MNYLRCEALNDPLYVQATFENDLKLNPAMRIACGYVDQWSEIEQTGTGLLIWGDVGTGKSYMAAAIANALIEQDVSAAMLTSADYLSRISTLKFDEQGRYLDSILRTRLMILDDFGMDRKTEYASERIFQLIDRRYRSQKPLIITSNMELKEFKNADDWAMKRVCDRILEMCVPVCCNGPNIRKIKAKANIDRMKNLLEQ